MLFIFGTKTTSGTLAFTGTCERYTQIIDPAVSSSDVLQHCVWLLYFCWFLLRSHLAAVLLFSFSECSVESILHIRVSCMHIGFGIYLQLSVIFIRWVCFSLTGSDCWVQQHPSSVQPRWVMKINRLHQHTANEMQLIRYQQWMIICERCAPNMLESD